MGVPFGTVLATISCSYLNILKKKQLFDVCLYKFLFSLFKIIGFTMYMYIKDRTFLVYFCRNFCLYPGCTNFCSMGDNPSLEKSRWGNILCGLLLSPATTRSRDIEMPGIRLSVRHTFVSAFTLTFLYGFL